jgi:hypothetical protein
VSVVADRVVQLHVLGRLLYHTISYHILYHSVQYHTIPYHTIPYHTIPYHTIPYHTIPYHTIPCYYWEALSVPSPRSSKDQLVLIQCYYRRKPKLH